MLLSGTWHLLLLRGTHHLRLFARAVPFASGPSCTTLVVPLLPLLCSLGHLLPHRITYFLLPPPPVSASLGALSVTCHCILSTAPGPQHRSEVAGAALQVLCWNPIWPFPQEGLRVDSLVPQPSTRVPRPIRSSHMGAHLHCT